MTNRIIFIFTILFCWVFISCQKGKEEELDVDSKPFKDKSQTTHIDSVVIQQHVKSLYIPAEVTFAGERVPLERKDVREALENELMINCFRHSKTLALVKTISRWSPLILKTLEEQGVPSDFIYLAVAESEFDNTARSYVGATGMWQFMETTGKEYGLEMNKWVDMRRDPVQSTLAASKYLKSAHEKFDSWTLAAASYNCGRSGLLRNMQKQDVNSYYDLYLNKETARYVYRIIAFKLILENPVAYGYAVSEADKYAPLQFTELEITDDIDDLVAFAKKHGTTYKVLRIYNPWFNNTSSYKLKLRRGDKFTMRIPKNE